MTVSQPTISAIIPTPGRGRPLARLLTSVVSQCAPGDEVLIVGDTHDGSLPEVERLCADFGPSVRYLAHDAGHHCWGHCQINRGMGEAHGDWLCFNDDDDVFTREAFASIRSAARSLPSPRPLLFQMITRQRLLIGLHPPVIAPGQIGGHMFVAPNAPEKLGRWDCTYIGELAFIRGTFWLWRPTLPQVASGVLAFVRPDDRDLQFLRGELAGEDLIRPLGVPLYDSSLPRQRARRRCERDHRYLTEWIHRTGAASGGVRTASDITP